MVIIIVLYLFQPLHCKFGMWNVHLLNANCFVAMRCPSLENIRALGVLACVGTQPCLPGSSESQWGLGVRLLLNGPASPRLCREDEEPCRGLEEHVDLNSEHHLFNASRPLGSREAMGMTASVFQAGFQCCH